MALFILFCFLFLFFFVGVIYPTKYHSMIRNGRIHLQKRVWNLLFMIISMVLMIAILPTEVQKSGEPQQQIEQLKEQMQNQKFRHQQEISQLQDRIEDYEEDLGEKDEQLEAIKKLNIEISKKLPATDPQSYYYEKPVASILEPKIKTPSTKPSSSTRRGGKR